MREARTDLNARQPETDAFSEAVGFTRCLNYFTARGSAARVARRRSTSGKSRRRDVERTRRIPKLFDMLAIEGAW